ncbi:hypothetical protein R6Q59_025216 [Mikania micrantha]
MVNLRYSILHKSCSGKSIVLQWYHSTGKDIWVLALTTLISFMFDRVILKSVFRPRLIMFRRATRDSYGLSQASAGAGSSHRQSRITRGLAGLTLGSDTVKKNKNKQRSGNHMDHGYKAPKKYVKKQLYAKHESAQVSKFSIARRNFEGFKSDKKKNQCFACQRMGHKAINFPSKC